MRVSRILNHQTRQRQDNWIKRLKRQKDEKQFLSMIMNIICIKRTRSRTRRDSFAPIDPTLSWCFLCRRLQTWDRFGAETTTSFRLWSDDDIDATMMSFQFREKKMRAENDDVENPD